MRGYEGFRCGPARYGLRAGGALLSLSGQAASDRLDVALDVAANVSRVDLAVTVQLTPPDFGLEEAVWADVRAWYIDHPNQLKASFIQDLGQGRTVYVGSRQSERMLRVYDKAAEADARDDERDRERYVGCHRFELEVKGASARPTALAVSAAVFPGYHVASTVAHYCAQHGIDHSPFSDAPMGLVPGFRRRSDTDSKLRWLGHSCRPTVEWLRDHGHQARVLRALGYGSEDAVRLLQLDEVRK